MSFIKPDVQGALALCRGLGSFAVDTTSNGKLARVSKAGKAAFAIQIDTDTLHLWTPTVSIQQNFTAIPHAIRKFGYDRNGEPAALGQPGMHSGLKPFLGTNELTCFSPISLDEAWQLIKAFST